MFSFVASILAAGTEITIRHVCVQTDLPVLKDLFIREFFNSSPRSTISIEDLRKIYTPIALSPNADAYLAFANDMALFVFEVHEAKYYDTYPGLPVEQGDWMVDLYITRHALMEKVLYIEALRTCIAECFHQPGLRALLLEPRYSGQYQWIKEFLITVGFRLWKKGSLTAGKEIYLLSKDTP